MLLKRLRWEEGKRSQRVGPTARLCRERLRAEPTASPAHGESRLVPVPQERCQAPSKAPLSPVVPDARLCCCQRARGGCRSTAFLHGAASPAGWRVVRHKAPMPALPRVQLGLRHSRLFPSSTDQAADSFANISFGQEALSHPQPRAPIPPLLSQALPWLSPFCQIAGL